MAVKQLEKRIKIDQYCGGIRCFLRYQRKKRASSAVRQKKIKIQAASQADDRVRGFLAGDHQGAVPALSA